MAVVVRREPASSAQVGNTALITEAGDCHGWLGRQLHSVDGRARGAGDVQELRRPD